MREHSMRILLLSTVFVLACAASSRSGSGASFTRAREIETVERGPGVDREGATSDMAGACPLPRIGLGACLPGTSEHIAAEVTCARQYNRTAIDQALAAAGLTRVEGLTGPDPLKAFPSHLEEDDLTQVREVDGVEIRSVSLGIVSDQCGRVLGPLAVVARGADGQLWLVQPRPVVVQTRTYTVCGCNYPCGGAPQPIVEAVVDLPAGERLAGRRELPVPQLTVGSRGSEECPPPP